MILPIIDGLEAIFIWQDPQNFEHKWCGEKKKSLVSQILVSLYVLSKVKCSGYFRFNNNFFPQFPLSTIILWHLCCLNFTSLFFFRIINEKFFPLFFFFFAAFTFLHFHLVRENWSKIYIAFVAQFISPTPNTMFESRKKFDIEMCVKSVNFFFINEKTADIVLSVVRKFIIWY